MGKDFRRKPVRTSKSRNRHLYRCDHLGLGRHHHPDFENTPYGFTAYSGNGGVGTVNSVYATVPLPTRQRILRAGKSRTNDGQDRRC